MLKCPSADLNSGGSGIRLSMIGFPVLASRNRRRKLALGLKAADSGDSRSKSGKSTRNIPSSSRDTGPSRIERFCAAKDGRLAKATQSAIEKGTRTFQSLSLDLKKTASSRKLR